MLQKLTTVLILALAPFAAAAQWSLDSCLQYALRHNHQLLAALESNQAAAREERAARAALLPTINATGQMDYNYKIPIQVFPGELVGQPPGTYIPVRISTPWLANYGLEAGVSLVDAGSWQSVKLGVLQSQQQAAQTASFKVLLERNVRQSFYDMQVRRQKLHITQEQARSYAHMHRLIAAQFGKGLIDKIALNQSQTLLTNRQEAAQQAQTALQVARLTLKGWMGYPFRDSLQIVTDTSLEAPQAPVFDPQYLPGFEAEQLKTQVAEREWKVARSRWWPVLSASASYSRLAFGSSFDFWQQGDWYDVGTVGLRLRIPLLSARELFHEPARRKLLWQRSLQEFAHYRQTQEQSYRQEKLQLQDAWQSVQAAREKIMLAEQNVQLSLHKLEKGLVNMIEIRQVTEDLYQAHQDHLQAKLGYWQHYTTLHYLQNRP
ncbi:TolC family protein [Chitinophaga japonensis]|uniref:Outer membrane protein TolC n=1 Tax=Chitinophaga japonensis TaxID=104662 RepID=A0A562T6D5_CHIJA|nr:TolC family protein [Chitinophaga japonensis]TWI89085.1 outer membrane protein TolC [Chitinophaga japonensis]